MDFDCSEVLPRVEEARDLVYGPLIAQDVRQDLSEVVLAIIC